MFRNGWPEFRQQNLLINKRLNQLFSDQFVKFQTGIDYLSLINFKGVEIDFTKPNLTNTRPNLD